MTKTDIFEEYAQIQEEINERELKKEQLRPHILKSMIDNGLKQKDIGVGKFSVATTKKWSYPADIVEQEEEVKALKSKAQSTGDATFEETQTFKYSPIKL